MPSSKGAPESFRGAADIAALPYRRNVGVMLVNGEGLVFAGQRIDNPGDAWQMPQGGIDGGEEPRAAALRELTEETGVPAHAVSMLAEMEGWLSYDLPADLQPTIWGGRYRGQQQKWFLMRLEGPDSLIDIGGDDPEFSRWCWMAPEELIGRIVPFKRDVYRAVFDAFAPALAGASAHGG
jgi:putative (di)nucleoside polyphosphate hydrolase